MKQVFSLALALLLVLGLSVPAFAATVDENTLSQAGNTTVTYTVEPTYTVTIPATVTLGGTATVSAEDVMLDEGDVLNVKITATSEEDNSFQVSNGKTAKLTYTVADDSTTYALGDAVLTVNPAAANSGSNTLTFTAPAAAIYSGTYTGTVTFTVAVETTVQDYTGNGTVANPYVVYTKNGILEVMQSTQNATNYIELANDIDASGEYIDQGSSAVVLDLKGHTLSARTLYVMANATVKNGTAPAIYVKMGTSATLSGLQVTIAGGGSAVTVQGTAVIDDCTFVSEPTASFNTYALQLGSIQSNVIATNVTLTAGTAAYDTNSDATFMLDSVSITEDCPTATYKTAGRA